MKNPKTIKVKVLPTPNYQPEHIISNVRNVGNVYDPNIGYNNSFDTHADYHNQKNLNQRTFK